MEQAPLQQLLTLVLVPAFAALIGAWAGARTAIDRFTRERAIDRQLGWLESTLKACVTLRNARRELFEDVKNREIEFISENLKKCLDSARDLEGLFPLAGVYGDQATLSAFERYLDQSRSISGTLPARVDSSSTQPIEQALEGLLQFQRQSKNLESIVDPLVEALSCNIRSVLSLK